MKNIYVGNLAAETTEQAMRTAFAAFGTVQKVSIARDRHTGEPRGFGFVEMQTAVEGDAAIAALHGTQLDGRTLAVNEARPRGAKPVESGTQNGPVAIASEAGQSTAGPPVD